MACSSKNRLRNRRALCLVLPVALAVSFFTCFFSISNSTRFSRSDNFDKAKHQVTDNFVPTSTENLERSNVAISDVVLNETLYNVTHVSDVLSDPTCESRWGWKLFEEWLSNQRLIISGDSNVNCAANVGTYAFCKFSNVTIDFSKGAPNGIRRFFRDGFFTSRGNMLESRYSFDIPGMHHINFDDNMDDDIVLDFAQPDEVESRPTFIISNDDIFNLGHYMNDVMNVWQMAILAGRNTKDSILINFDGFREAGPAGGPSNRLMVPSDVDCYGPYIDYYKSWFSEMKKAVFYRGKRVKYAELYIPSNPYYPWFWNEWYTESLCALKSSSPLYQSFNTFLINRWMEYYGPDSLKKPDSDRVHIVLEVRPINRKKRDGRSSARHIKNVEDLVKEMQLIPNVRVTAQDFTLLSFKEQVSLSHSAGVFVSMHGAGTTHIFHSALGAPNCCALVELQPGDRFGYTHTKGYANLARMLGLHYYRYGVSNGRTSSNGTTVDVADVIALIQQAVDTVRSSPIRLNDVRDTQNPSDLDFKWL